MVEQQSDVATPPDLCVAFGSLRSGTTMLRLMMDGHPQFVCPGESDFLLDYLVPAETGGWRYDLEALAANRAFQASGLRLPDTQEALPAFASMVAQLRGASGKCLVLVLHRGVERLLEIEPQIRILHLVRDPRDVARSAIGMGWAGNVYYGARTWLASETEWDRVAPRIPPHQSLEFQYEALVSTPEDILRQVCAFLECDYDPGMLSYPDHSTYKPVDASLAEQWRRKQTPRELGLSEPLFGDLLTRRGYAPSGHPQIHPGFVERLQLKLEHSSSVWRRRIARYGLRDPLIVSLCQKIGAPKLARPAQQRMNAITEQYLK